MFKHVVRLLPALLYLVVSLSPALAKDVPYEKLIREFNPALSESRLESISRGLDQADKIMDGISGEVFARAVGVQSSYQTKPDSDRGLTRLPVETLRKLTSANKPTENPTVELAAAARHLRNLRRHYGSWTVAFSHYFNHDYAKLHRVLDTYYPKPDLLPASRETFTSRRKLYRHAIKQLYDARGATPGSCSGASLTANPDKVARTILRVAGEEGVSPDLIFAVAWQESNIRCIRGDYHLPHRAYGMMQVQLRTARSMLEDPVGPDDLQTNLETNIRAGARYLVHWENEHENLASAIYNYNGGSMRYTHRILARWAWVQSHLHKDTYELAFKQSPSSSH